jgi:hypothetical protein
MILVVMGSVLRVVWGVWSLGKEFAVLIVDVVKCLVDDAMQIGSVAFEKGGARGFFASYLADPDLAEVDASIPISSVSLAKLDVGGDFT